jgi:hypothetical protein
MLKPTLKELASAESAHGLNATQNVEELRNAIMAHVTRCQCVAWEKLVETPQGCLNVVLKFECSLQPESLYSDELESASECSALLITSL